MALRNTASSYGSLSITLHWIMALMVIGMLGVGFYMTSLPDSGDKWQLYGMHKAFGLLVLTVALFRWYWMLTNKRPEALETYSKFDIAVAHASKWIMMLLLVGMPCSGILMSLASTRDVSFFGLFTIEGFAEKHDLLADIGHEGHEIGAVLFAIFVGLHILAALKHHFMDKDSTLNRMLGRS